MRGLRGPSDRKWDATDRKWNEAWRNPRKMGGYYTIAKNPVPPPTVYRSEISQDSLSTDGVVSNAPVSPCFPPEICPLPRRARGDVGASLRAERSVARRLGASRRRAGR